MNSFSFVNPLSAFTTLLVVDLEATCWESESGPSRQDMETIEFGAVLVRMADLQPLDERSWIVRPTLHPTLSAYCVNLTTITQDMVDKGIPFARLCELVAGWIEPYRSNLAWGSWGQYDVYQLEKDARRIGRPHPLTDIPHFNLKQLFAKCHRTGKPRPGMERALKLCGLALDGTHHRGIDDARNIARILPFICDPNRYDAVQERVALERRSRLENAQQQGHSCSP